MVEGNCAQIMEGLRAEGMAGEPVRLRRGPMSTPEAGVFPSVGVPDPPGPRTGHLEGEKHIQQYAHFFQT